MVKQRKRTVIWNTAASEQFRKAYEWIRNDSYDNAEKIIRDHQNC